MGIVEQLKAHVQENRRGMFVDIVFAIAWVTLIHGIFQFVDGPDWAYYFLLATGIVAYFAFFWSLELALENTD
ncbi:hypothetical protein K0C01_00495 [Salinarchaeum sp. IM2453]|uniref:hypothetical protein n=1 Tax=Salinarchaeum sp. IM2453 TaxID=2862870 RepID=UPI001C831568|nr:hypothetical protein [Salinarchaeum sp. IM2453]QZA88689.1 hypothetical protein K0C01_00495 [Salinarchaeum sp. IM2453]